MLGEYGVQVNQAKKLADCLMGLDDAKETLVMLYERNMAGDESPQIDRAMQDAAEQWHQSYTTLATFVEDFESPVS
jgi:hypothetical protein